MHVRIDAVSRSLALRRSIQVLSRELDGISDTRIYVVSLLKIDVFKKIAAHRPCRDGVAVHFDSPHVGNRTLHRHQPLTQVLIDAEFQLSRCHVPKPMRRLLYIS